MLGYFRTLFIVATGMLLVSNAHAQKLEDLLLDALKDFAEEKAEEAGLLPSGDQRKPEPKTVNLVFTGAESPEPDVFFSLHEESASSNGSGQTSAERECYNRVQNKIAWNTQGNKRWTDASIKSLCKGTSVPAAPPQCFSTAMYRGVTWGQRPQHKMNWSLASQLCGGTNNAQTPINCLKTKVGQNWNLAKAVNACDGKPDTV